MVAGCEEKRKGSRERCDATWKDEARTVPSWTSSLCLGATWHPCEKAYVLFVRQPSAAEGFEKMKGKGGKATLVWALVWAPDADILREAIEELRKRTTAGAATFLVKVKVHRVEPANKEAEIQADKTYSKFRQKCSHGINRVYRLYSRRTRDTLTPDRPSCTKPGTAFNKESIKNLGRCTKQFRSQHYQHHGLQVSLCLFWSFMLLCSLAVRWSSTGHCVKIHAFCTMW